MSAWGRVAAPVFKPGRGCGAPRARLRDAGRQHRRTTPTPTWLQLLASGARARLSARSRPGFEYRRAAGYADGRRTRAAARVLLRLRARASGRLRCRRGVPVAAPGCPQAEAPRAVRAASRTHSPSSRSAREGLHSTTQSAVHVAVGNGVAAVMLRTPYPRAT